METKANVFVNIGDHRKAIDAYIESQGLALGHLPSLRAAAKRFVHLTDAEQALPKDRRDAVQEARRAESQRLLKAIDEVTPQLKARRTVSGVINEALVKYLATLTPQPDVRTTFKDLSPDLQRLAR